MVVGLDNLGLLKASRPRPVQGVESLSRENLTRLQIPIRYLSCLPTQWRLTVVICSKRVYGWSNLAGRRQVPPPPHPACWRAVKWRVALRGSKRARSKILLHTLLV